MSPRAVTQLSPAGREICRSEAGIGAIACVRLFALYATAVTTRANKEKKEEGENALISTSWSEP